MCMYLCMQGGPGKVLGDSMFLQTSCGSPNYAAPEIVSGVEYDGFQVDNFFILFLNPNPSTLNPQP